MIENFSKVEYTQKEAEKLVFKYLKLCKETRNSLQENENGVFKINDLNVVQKDILNSQKNLPDFIGDGKNTGVNSFKPSLFKNGMSYTGILGYYNPFTAEAQYNPNVPSTSIPFTLAHESMHQFGIAREQEANFGAYLIGKDSKNLEIRYSIQYFVLKSLLESLVEKNPEFVKQTVKNYSPEMLRDRQAEIDFRKEHEGIFNAIFGFTNDLFLKSNQQEGSVTYSYFVDLLIRYENQSNLK